MDELKTASREKTETILKGVGKGFEKRKSISFREEDAQAALIRDIILNQYGGFTFIASEFDLFDFGENKEIKRPDVFVYKDGILYDIELKNERNGPKAGNIGYSPITQAESYVAHMNDPRNRDAYISCITAFPNSIIGKITDIRGVAVVPVANGGKSKGTLENAAKDAGVELWTFEKGDTLIFKKIKI